MTTHLQYGTTGLELDLTGLNATVLSPRFLDGLPDEAAAFTAALRAPLGARPLRETIAATDRVAVVIPDGTRPLPSDRLLPWLFAELAHVPRAQFTILIGTGSHRANTAAELDAMLGPRIARGYRIVNHAATDDASLASAGRSPLGYEVRLARDYVAADRRILLGFIEPHFMAGFSGGYKAVFPGLAALDAIMHYHGADVIGDPRSTWGELEDNPTQRHVRAGGSLLPVDFCINVTLNTRRQITRYFCGDTLTAHRAGCAFVKATAMAPCDHDFPIVVTTNSGFPLDQSLYQTVKGMAAASRIVSPGGLILTAARCNDGFPAHGNFRKLVEESRSARELMDRILAPGFAMLDQWQAQHLAMVLLKARVALYSELADADVRRAHLTPVHDLRAALDAELARLGPGTPIAVLPEGPLTIPYRV
ncbi:MAG: nickel-dependent lactate racemase [Opitutales bacterium]|nr:nickel-dependent lactate racemase [Opitutales bacterium]